MSLIFVVLNTVYDVSMSFSSDFVRHKLWKSDLTLCLWNDLHNAHIETHIRLWTVKGNEWPQLQIFDIILNWSQLVDHQLQVLLPLPAPAPHQWPREGSDISTTSTSWPLWAALDHQSVPSCNTPVFCFALPCIEWGTVVEGNNAHWPCNFIVGLGLDNFDNAGNAGNVQLATWGSITEAPPPFWQMARFVK